LNPHPSATAPPGSAPHEATAAETPLPPLAPQFTHLSNWHGQEVDDRWYWLREKDSAPVLDYLKAENGYTEACTRGLAAFTEALYQEMLGRIQQTDLDVPVRRGAWYYYNRTVEGQQYPIRCRRAATATGQDDPTAVEQVILDQNAMAKGLAFLSVVDLRVSDDGHQLLYLADDTGYRQYKLYRKDLLTGQVSGPLAERVTGVEWAADNRTIYWTTEHPVSKRSDTLWRLRGDGPAQNLYVEADELYQIDLGRSKDRLFLILEVGATDTWETHLIDATQPDAPLRVVLPRRKGHKYQVEHREGRLVIRTNREAKDFRVVTAPLDDPRPEQWEPLVDHRPGTLVEGVQVFRDHLVVSEKSAGLTRFRIQDLQTRAWTELPFSATAYAAMEGDTPEFASQNFRYGYQSMVTPSSVYDYDFKTGASRLLKQQAVLGGYDESRYTTERLWATARDGTRVPISIVYRNDRPRNGTAPLWLYGYGSYGLGMSATFGSWRLSLLDRGVAFAIAHIRGGDEMGETWHDDGMLMNKKNTFFDFIDCAEFLVQQKWSSSERLLIEGGSAGGLLMGVVSNLRPDLFKAVHSAVPFVDVMNSMMDASLPLTVGEYLEWGDPNEREAFDCMLSYSPYDNLTSQAYPAMLVTTSYNDSQVMYWEPAKYVAKLRTLKTDRNPLLLKTKMEPAGHGGASGRYDALKDRAFEVAWMLEQVGVAR
jgi:oligopeptidase B